LPKEFKKKTTVGIRVPDNSIALEIVQLGNPIVSTSIRDDDDVIEYTTDPELIFEKWQNLVDMVIDGGYGDNVGSTIIDLSGEEPTVLREGSLDILVKSNFGKLFDYITIYIAHKLRVDIKVCYS
jgi:tRNA A37 threonylcarbamoyladenosine synthetase subunit TsaC/SUA5/YrdC